MSLKVLLEFSFQLFYPTNMSVEEFGNILLKTRISLKNFHFTFATLDICFSYNPGQNISDKLYFLCELAPYGKISISIFQEYFASIDKIFILGGRLSTRL